jgi:antitoxin component YwqK of YwqJK toxin-antitoxin module
MKIICFKVLLLFTLLSYSQQKNTTVQFYNSKGEIVNDMSDSFYYQTIVKRKDSLYKVSRYRKNGNLFAYWFTQSLNPKDQIGQSVLLNSKGNISSVSFYNSSGEKHGKSESWFDNGNKNYEGRYINGKREGLWRFYHQNGKIAQQGFFKNDSVVKASYFDDKGIKMLKPLPCSKKIDTKGILKKIYRRISNMPFKVVDKIKGNITLRIKVTTDGKIKYIDNEGYIPLEVKDLFISKLEELEGFEPKILNNRKIPTILSIPIKFK